MQSTQTTIVSRKQQRASSQRLLTRVATQSCGGNISGQASKAAGPPGHPMRRSTNFQSRYFQVGTLCKTNCDFTIRSRNSRPRFRPGARPPPPLRKSETLGPPRATARSPACPPARRHLPIQVIMQETRRVSVNRQAGPSGFRVTRYCTRY